MRLLKIGCFKRDHEKGSLIFSFAPLAPFYRQNYEKQKGLELVTSLFELQNMLTKIPVLVWSFESGNCRKKRKKWQSIEYLMNEKSFVNELKTIFYNAFFW